MRHYGPEFLDDPRLNTLHRTYIRIFGIPISGLRIRLRRILPAIQGNFRSMIDLGCGKGVFTFELARRFPGAKITAVDIDEKQVEVNRQVAKKHGHRNIDFEVQDILNMPYESQFDLAVSVDNLEHIQDDVAALKVVHRALKPGGKLVCHVPALERIWLFKGIGTNFDVPGHVRAGYRLEELADKLKTAGFTVKKIGHTYGYLETVTNNISYLITGAAEKNKLVYAFTFPILNSIAWLGRNQDPKDRGAGILAIAEKSE